MKNHNVIVLPTKDENTRVGKFIDTQSFVLRSENDIPRGVPHHIFIISDEEIKDCWVLNLHTNEIYFLKGYYGIQPFAKKIILTTDQSLDGVQAIDDEFLKWFVQNPSCKSVDLDTFSMGDKVLYNVVFPKEEPKQEYKSECICENSCRGFVNVKCKQLKKQETLEEAAKWSLEKAEEFALERFKSGHKKGIITWESILEILKVGVLTGHKFGVKWQAERGYTLDQISKDFVGEGRNGGYFDDFLDYRINTRERITFKDWFERFKKK